MKKIYILILNLFFIYGFSQNSSIEYSSIPRKTEPKSDMKEVNDIIIETNNTHLSFKLEFNQNQSNFLEINTNDEEKTLGQTTNLLFLGYKPFYYFKNTNQFYFINSDVLVEKKQVIINWNITTETKKIDNYTCYKATYEEKFINRANKEAVKIITAWFCPELPFSYGPAYYNGLPGIILELERNGYKYVAKKINITKNNDPIVLPKLKIVSEEEYLKRLLENLPTRN